MQLDASFDGWKPDNHLNPDKQLCTTRSEDSETKYESSGNAADDNNATQFDNYDTAGVTEKKYRAALEEHFAHSVNVHRNDGSVLLTPVKSISIELLNPQNQVVSEDSVGRRIEAVLQIHLDDYRPHLMIEINQQERKTQQRRTGTVSDTDIQSSIFARYPYKCIDQKLSGTFEDEVLGVKVISLDDTMSAANCTQDFVSSLPPETAARIDKINDIRHQIALLCTITHRKDGMLDRGVSHNVPEWAINVAPILRSRVTRFLIQGGSSTARAIAAFMNFWNHKRYSYQAFHIPGRRDGLHYRHDSMVPPGTVDLSPETYHFSPVYQFQDLHEYATLSYVIISESISRVRKSSRDFTDAMHKLLLIPSAIFEGNAHYLGFIKVVSGYHPLRAGDLMQLSFDPEESFDEKEEERESPL